MKEILNYHFENIIVSAIEILPNILAALLVFILTIYFGKFVNKLFKKLLQKSDIEEIHFDLYLKISKVFFFFIATILFLNIIGLKSIATGLFTGGGVLTVILGFAFREIGENLIAGILLSFNRPFRKGDLIKSGNFEGTVKSIEIRSTNIRTSDGQDIFIPCAQIYKNPLINYTKDGLRRFSLNIGISYDDDVNLACDLITKEMQKIKAILKTPKASAAFNKALPNYIEITAYFWIDIFSSENNVSKVKTSLICKIKEQLRNSDFTLSCDVSDNVNFKVSQDVPIGEGLAH